MTTTGQRDDYAEEMTVLYVMAQLEELLAEPWEMHAATAWVLNHILTPYVGIEDQHLRAAAAALETISDEEPDNVVVVHAQMQQALNLLILVVLDRGWMTM